MNLEALVTGALGGLASGIAIPIVRDWIVWRVEKRRWAREMLHDSLARIANLADDADCEFTGQFALAGQRPSEGVAETIELVKTLHKNNHRLALYLSGKDKRALANFLSDARKSLNEATETWGQWEEHEGDIAIGVHHTATLHAFGKAARDSLGILAPAGTLVEKTKQKLHGLVGKAPANNPPTQY